MNNKLDFFTKPTPQGELDGQFDVKRLINSSLLNSIDKNLNKLKNTNNSLYKKYQTKLKEFIEAKLLTFKNIAGLTTDKLQSIFSGLWVLFSLTKHLSSHEQTRLQGVLKNYNDYLVRYFQSNDQLSSAFINQKIAKLTTAGIRSQVQIGSKENQPTDIKKFLDNLCKSSPFIKYDPQKEPENFTIIYKNSSWKGYFVYETMMIALVSKENPQISLIVSEEDLLQKIKGNRINELFEKAKQNYQKSLQNKAKLRNVDLPRNEKIKYLKVFPASFDPIIQSSLSSSALLTSALTKQYKNLEHDTVFSDSPLQSITNLIKKDYLKGVRNFYLDFYTHGSQSELKYKNPINSVHLVSLMHQFPQAKFVINTMACFGGGLMPGLKNAANKDKNLADRLMLFTQTKSDLPNLPGGIQNQNKRAEFYSTYYQLFFIQALQQGKKFGEAHHYADQQAKKIVYLDAEALIKGEYFVKKIKPDVEAKERVA